MVVAEWFQSNYVLVFWFYLFLAASVVHQESLDVVAVEVRWVYTDAAEGLYKQILETCRAWLRIVFKFTLLVTYLSVRTHEVKFALRLRVLPLYHRFPR